MGTHPSFSTMFSKGEILVTVCLPTLKMKSSQNGVKSYGKNLLQWEQILAHIKWPHFIWEATMIMTELLPLKVYLSTLMKAVVYSVQTYSFHYIYCIAPMCDSTEYPWHGTTIVNLMWIRISTKEFLKSHHTDRQPFVLKFMILSIVF